MRRSRPAEGARSVRLSIWLGRLRYAVAAADQIGLSLFSFGLNFCLLRILTAQEFGVVTLWMALALLAVAVQGALVALPLSVHVAAAADPAAAQRLEDSLASVNAIIVVLTAIIVAGGTALYEPESIASDAVMVAAITLFVVTSLTREYRRAIAFARNDMLLLLAVDIPFVTVTGIGVAAMLLWRWQGAGLDATFLALALGGAAGQVCSRFAMRRPPGRWFRPGWPATYRTVARETVWSLVAGLATDLQNRSYVYVTTTMIGVTEVGALNAVGVLFRPARILVSAWGRSALPRLAGLAAGQQLQSFDRALLAPLAIGAAASGMVYLALWVAWRPIAHYVLADKYPEAGMLLLPWALASGLNIVDYIVGVALQATREFRYLAHTALLGAPINAAATIAAVWWHGYSWAMYGVSFGTAAILAAQGARLLAVRRRMARLAPGHWSSAPAKSGEP